MLFPTRYHYTFVVPTYVKILIVNVVHGLMLNIIQLLIINTDNINYTLAKILYSFAYAEARIYN